MCKCTLTIAINIIIFRISVCDVLPHLLASENMTVQATHVSSSSSHDEEVCNFLQGHFWSIFVDMIILVNEVVTLKQHQEQEEGVELGRDANLWEIWNLLTVSFAVTLSQYHPPHYTSYTHKSTGPRCGCSSGHYT